MTLENLEKRIVKELKAVTGIKELRVSNLMEWNKDRVTILRGLKGDEQAVYIKKLGVWVAYKE